MSKCQHIHVEAHYERNSMICCKCGADVFELAQQENADIRAKLEAEVLTSSVLRAKLLQSEDDRDNLQARVVLLSGALLSMTSGLGKVMPIMVYDALSTTPQQAAERVQGLVDALEKLARLGGPGGGYGNSVGNEIAQNALAKYRGNR